MDGLGMSVMAGLALGVLGLFGGAFALARRRLRLAAPAPAPVGAPVGAGDPDAPAPASRRVERRIEALESAQAGLAGRIEALADAGGAARIQALAGSLVGLIRDKNATLETALAGLDQLRCRLRTLEQVGDPAEARGLVERLGARLDEIQTAQAAAQAATEARIAALRADAPLAEICGQLTRLYAQKDATIETVFARLDPLEARLGEIERLAPRLGAIEAEMAARDPQAGLESLGRRLAELQAAQGETAGRLALQQAEPRPHGEIAARLTLLQAQKDALVETVSARLGALEARLGAFEAETLDEDGARAEAQAIAAQLIAAHAIAEQTALFSDRIALLEASLPRLSLAQSLMMQALERQAAPAPPAKAEGAPAARPALPAALSPPPSAAPPSAAPEPPAPAQDLWRAPRVVSAQQK